MSRRLTLSLFAVLLATTLGTARAQEADLAARLPADRTALYMHVPMKALLAEIEATMKVYDEEQTAVVTGEVRKMYGMMREWLAGAHEFDPQLLDHWAGLEHYWILMAKKEPATVERTYETPVWDPDTGELVPGRTETHTDTDRISFVFTYAIAAPDEAVATEFTDQMLALAERLKEQGEIEGDPYRVADVDAGALWELGPASDDAPWLGRMGRYITFSNHQPVDLWQSLMAGSDAPLSQTAAYQRQSAFPGGQVARFLLSPKSLAAAARLAMDDRLAAAQKAVQAGEEDAQFELSLAQEQIKAYTLSNALLSLDKLEHVGFVMASTERPGRSDLMAMLAHADGLSPLMQSILDGPGRPFQLPPVVPEDALYMAAQIDLAGALEKVIATLGAFEPQAVMGYQAAMAMMQGQVGTDLPTLLKLLGGDYQLAMKLNAKEIEVPDWTYDEQTEEWTEKTRKQMMLLPEVTALLGLQDAAAARTQISGLFTKAAANPQVGGFVRKRTFMDTPVYCIGVGVSEEEKFPDGMTSFAIAIVDRYLTSGSWENVTGVIRAASAGGVRNDRLAAVMQANPRANMLAYVSSAFQRHVQAETEKLPGAEMDPFEELLEELDVEDLEEFFKDADLAARMRASIERAVNAMKVLAEKMNNEKARGIVLTGEHKGNFYEVHYEELE